MPVIGYYLLGVAAILAFAAASRRASAATPVDAYADHEPAEDCDPQPKPGTLAFRAFVLSRWGEKAGSPQNIVRDCSVGARSEHHEGRAWDMMVRDKAHGQAVVDALLAADPTTGERDALARRAGIMYMIWDRKMWRAYPWAGAPRGTWTPYSGASSHEDHVHFSLSRRGAAAKTSLYRG